MIIVYILGSFLLTISYTTCYVINSDRYGLGYINSNQDAETNPYNFYVENNKPSPYLPVNYMVPYAPVYYVVPSYFHNYMFTSDLSVNRNEPKTSAVVDDSHILDVARINYDKNPENHKNLYTAKDDNADSLNEKWKRFFIRHDQGPLLINADISFVPSEDTNHENYQKNLSYEEDTANGINNTPNEDIFKNTPKILGNQGNAANENLAKDSENDVDRVQSSLQSTQDAELPQTIEPLDHTFSTKDKVSTELDNENESQEKNLKKSTSNKRGIRNILLGALRSAVKSLLGEDIYDGIETLFKKRSLRNLVGLLEDIEQESTINTTPVGKQLDKPDISKESNLKEKVETNTRSIGTLSNPIKKIFKKRSLIDLMRQLKDFEEESIIDTILSDAELYKHNEFQQNNLEKKVAVNTRILSLMHMFLTFVGSGVSDLLKNAFKTRSVTDLLRLVKDFEEESTIDTFLSDAELDNQDVNNLENNVMINTRGIGSFFMGIFQSIVDAFVGEGVQKLYGDRSFKDLLRSLEDFDEEPIIDTILSDAELYKHNEFQQNNLEKKVAVNTRILSLMHMFLTFVGSGVSDLLKNAFKTRSVTDLLRLVKDFEEESTIDTFLSDAELNNQDVNNLENNVMINTRGIGSFFMGIFQSIVDAFVGEGVQKLYGDRSFKDLLRSLEDFDEEPIIDTILSDAELYKHNEFQQNNLEKKVAVNTRILSLMHMFLTFVGSAVSDLIKNASKTRSVTDLLRLVKDFEEESTIDNILSGTELNNQDESQENNSKKKSTQLGAELYNQESTMKKISTTGTRSILALLSFIGFTVSKFLAGTFVYAAESAAGSMMYEGIKKLITLSKERSTINTTNPRSILGIIGGAVKEVVKNTAQNAIGQTIWEGIKNIFKKRTLRTLVRLLEDTNKKFTINTTNPRSILGIIGGAVKEVLKNTAQNAIGQTIWEGIKNIFKKRTLRTLVRLLEDNLEKPTINTRIKNVLPVGWILTPSSFLTGRPVKFIKDTGIYETSNIDDNKNWEEFVLNKHFIDEKGLFNVEVNSNSNEREHTLKIKVNHKSPEKIFLVDIDKYIYDIYKTFKDINKHSKKDKKTTRVRRNLQSIDSVGLRDNLEQLNNPNDIGNEDNILREPCLYEPFKIDNNVLQQIFFNILYLNKHLEDLNWFERREIKPLFLKYVQSLANTYLSPDMKIDLYNLRNYITAGYLNNFYFGIKEPTVLEVIHELMNTVNNIIFKHQNDREMLKLIDEQNDRHGKINFVIVKRFKFGNSSLILKIISSSKEQHTVDIELIHTSAEPFSTREVINKYLRRTFKTFKHPKEPLQKIKELMKNLLDSKKLDQLTNLIKKDPGNLKDKSPNKNNDNEFKPSSNNENEVKPFEDFIDDKFLDLEREEHNFFSESSENESIFTTDDMSFRETNVKQILSKLLPTNTILKDINAFKQKHFESPLNDKKRKNVNHLLEKMKKALKKLQFYLFFRETKIDSLEDIIEPDDNEENLYKYLQSFQKPFQDSIQNDAEQIPDNLEDQEQLTLNVNTLDQLVQLQGNYLNSLDDRFQAIALFNDNSLKQPFQEEVKGPQHNLLKNVLSKLQQINKLMKILNVIKQKRFQSHLKDDVRHHIIDVFGNMKRVLSELKTYVGEDKYIPLPNGDNIQDNLGNPEDQKSQQQTRVDVNQMDKLLRLQESYADSLQGIFEAEGIHTENIDDEDLNRSFKNESSIEKPSQNDNNTLQDTEDQKENPIDVNILDQLIGVQERYVDRLYDMFEAEQLYVEKHTNNDFEQQSSGRKGILSTRQNILEHIIPKVTYINHQLIDLTELKQKDLVSPINGNNVDTITDLLENMKNILEELKQYMGATKYSFDSLIRDKTLADNTIDNQQAMKDQAQNILELDKIDQFIRIQLSYADSLEDLIHVEDRQNDENMEDDLKKLPQGGSFDKNNTKSHLESDVKYLPLNLQNEEKHLRDLKVIDQLLKLQHSYLDSLDDMLQDEELGHDEDNVKQSSQNATTYDNKMSSEKDVEQKPRNMGIQQPHLLDVNTIDQYLQLQDNYNRLGDILAEVELDNDQYHDDLPQPVQDMSSHKKVDKLLLSPKGKILVKEHVLKEILSMLTQINQLLNDPKSYKQKKTKTPQKHTRLRTAFISDHQKTSPLKHDAEKKTKSSENKQLENNKKDKPKLTANNNDNKTLEDDAERKTKSAEDKNTEDNKKDKFAANGDDNKTLEHDVGKRTQSIEDEKIENNKNDKLKLPANRNDNKTLEDEAGRKTPSAQDEKIEDHKKDKLKLSANSNDHKTLEDDAERKTKSAEDKNTADNKKDKLSSASNGDNNKTLEHDVEKRTQSVEDEKIEDNKNDKLKLTADQNGNKTLEDEAERKTPSAQDEKIEDNRTHNWRLIENPDDNKTLDHDAEKKTQSAEDEKIEDSKNDKLNLSTKINDITLGDNAESSTQNVEDEKLKNNKQDEKLEVNAKHKPTLATHSNENKTLEDEVEKKIQSVDDKIIKDNEKHKFRMIENTNDSNTLENIGDKNLENLKDQELDQNKKEEFMANTNKTNTSINGDDENQKKLEDEEIQPGEKENNVGDAKPENRENKELEPNEKNEVILVTNNNDTNTNKTNTSTNGDDENQKTLEDEEIQPGKKENNVGDAKPENRENKELEPNEKNEVILATNTNDTNTNKTNTSTNGDDENQKKLEDEEIQPGKKENNVGDAKPENLENKELEPNEKDEVIPATNTNDTNTTNNNGNRTPETLDKEESEHNETEEFIKNNKTNTLKDPDDEKQENFKDEENEPELQEDIDGEETPENLENRELEHNANVTTTNDTNTVHNNDSVEQQRADQILSKANNNKTNTVKNDADKEDQNVEDQELGDNEKHEVIPEVNNKDDIEKKLKNTEDKEIEDDKSDNSVSAANINGTDTLKNDMANKLQNDKVVEKNINVTNTLGNHAEKNPHNLGDKELEDNNQDELLHGKNAIAEAITPSSRTSLKPKSKIRNMHDKKKTKSRNGKLNKNKSKDEDKPKKGNVRKEKQTYKENGKKSKNKNNTTVRNLGLPPQVEIEHDNPSSELTNLEDSVNIQSSDENKLSETTVLKPELPVTHTEPPPPIENRSQSNVTQGSQTMETQKPPDTIDFKIFRETENGTKSTTDYK
ncbi:unnamed protein product [Diabrotica balteata]|uniref:Uncharacterized protein n=1 Tax=Diabrotica balteata TaxID=107213 RepID=A0A9N9T1N0_DIABA|nr:unnamed protein product [Diabrotica balteata]